MSYAWDHVFVLIVLCCVRELHAIYCYRMVFLSVSTVVAEHHELIMGALESTIFEKLISFGHVHTQRTGLMQMFTMRSAHKQSQEDALQAAKPAAPRAHLAQTQRSISSFFVHNNNLH